MREMIYSRERAIAYAEKWAFKRNPKYMDFNRLGGDCTNFASQCLFAGCGVMNYAKRLGWYYESASNRAPSWSGVHFFHEFLMVNKGAGPYGAETTLDAAQLGDFIQLSDGNRFYHTVIITRKEGGKLFVAAHTLDAYDRALASYPYKKLRAIRILGCRK